MDLDITFVYEDKKYTVSSEAYDLNMIILPDGRAINADSWLESCPPQPADLHEVPHLFKNLELKEIANQLNGVLAEIVV